MSEYGKQKMKIMMIKKYSFFTILLILFMSKCSLNANEYDNDFKKAYAKGEVSNIVEYMGHLADLSSIKDQEGLLYNKNAIAYFFATGSQGGFRSEPATTAEITILKHALVVSSFISHFFENQKAYSLIDERRNNGFASEDDRVEIHLIACQGIITATRCVLESNNKEFIKEIYNKEYLLGNFNLKTFAPYINKLPEIFINNINDDLCGDVGNTLKDMSVYYQYFKNIEINITKSQLVSYCVIDNSIFKVVVTAPSRKIPLMEVILENGLSVTTANDIITLIPTTQNIALGFLKMGIGSRISYKTLNINGLNLSIYQSEKEFLEELLKISPIKSKKYL